MWEKAMHIHVRAPKVETKLTNQVKTEDEKKCHSAKWEVEYTIYFTFCTGRADIEEN